MTRWIPTVAVVAAALACTHAPGPREPVPSAEDADVESESGLPVRLRDASPRPSLVTADEDAKSDGADAPVVADAGRPLPSDGGPVPNMDPTCHTSPQSGMPCGKSYQVCRQPDGNPCNCNSKKVWVCATPCPPDTRTTTITKPTCDFPGQFCRRKPPPGSPTSTEADWCICGNHLSWDCLDIPACKTGVATGSACTPRSDPRPGVDRGRICQIPPPTGQAPEQICTCDVATVPTWKCQPTCPWGARKDGVCDRSGGACALLSRGYALVGGIFVAPCTCGEGNTLACGASLRYDWR